MSEQDSNTTEATEQGATPNDVAEVINQHLAQQQEPAAEQQTQQGEPDESALGDAGKRALQQEREWRETAERSAREWQTRAEQAEAAVAGVPSTVAESLRDHLTRWHGISDEDRDLFLTSTDPATLLKQVTRLTERAATTPAPTTPKPDRTQGGAGEPPALNSDALEDALRQAVGAR